MQFCLYRYPSQAKDESWDFIKNLELKLEHTVKNSPFLIAVLGTFKGFLSRF